MRLDAFMSLKLLVYKAATGGNAHRDPHARAVLLRLVFGLAGSERSLGFYQLNAEGSFEPPKEALVAQLQQAAGGVGLALLPEAYSGDCVACHRGMPGAHPHPLPSQPLDRRIPSRDPLAPAHHSSPPPVPTCPRQATKAAAPRSRRW